jgi:hypothetical protein
LHLQVEAQVEKRTSINSIFDIHKEKEMVAFRKWFPVLAIMGLTLGSAMTATAQTTSPTLTCNTNAGVPPIVRSEGYTELVGDVVLDCTGGNPAAPFLTNIQIFLNTNITSRLIDSANNTEALLMINDPAPSAQVLGTNVFRGAKSPQGQNSVLWAGLPITPPGTNHLILRITNVRANAAGLGVSSTLIPTQIVMFISASGSTSLAINQPQQTVAFIQQGLLFDVRSCTGGALAGTNLFNQCVAQNSSLFGGTLTATNSSQFGLRYREGFPSSFKPRFASATSGTTTTTNNPGGAGTVAYGPSVPGVVYNSETGFTNSTVLGGLTGFADNGTRLAARFNNIPAGVRIFVSVGQSIGSTTALAAGLIVTDANGAGSTGSLVPSVTSFLNCSNATGGFNPVTAPGIPAAELTVVNGSALAVWEVLASDPSASETAVFSVAVAFAANTANNLPGLGQSTVQGSFAPFYPTTFSPNPTQTQGSGMPIPRFIDSPVNANDFIVNTCQTNLLFPFVTNQAGFDSGIAISNTSRDPFGGTSRLQAGTCTINYYGGTTGGGAAPSAQTSASVDAGAQLLFVLSSGGNLGIAGTPGFQGYIIAQCRFQYAHGFAFVTDGPIGQARVAEGYLALVMDDSIGSRTGASSETLGN